MHKGSFGTAINCMDGRVQLPVITWLKTKYSLDYIDMITEPGPDKILSHGTPEQIASIKSRVLISVNNHGSKLILVAGHFECAGNPVDKEEHIQHIKQSMHTIHSWVLPVDSIVGAWISNKWTIEIIE